MHRAYGSKNYFNHFIISSPPPPEVGLSRKGSVKSIWLEYLSSHQLDSHIYIYIYTYLTEVVVRTCSIKKVFLEISQNSQDNILARVSLFKKRPWHRCFPVSFVKFLRISFFTEHLRWLVLT